MRFLTAGESHGPKLIGIIEGLPAGIPISKAIIDEGLRERQKGPGRGGRMNIEKDEVRIVSGVRGGFSTGAPVTLEIENKDWANWEQTMSPYPGADMEDRKVIAPRPGHADLTGALKYDTDVRNILERASARETAMRVAVGSIARQLLMVLGVEVRGRVKGVGNVVACDGNTSEDWQKIRDSEWKVGDSSAAKQFYELLEEARKQGESLGGVIEIQVLNIVPGLGSHVQWDRKLDGKLAQAVLSVQAMKGIAFGLGFEAGKRFGSQVHDPITYEKGIGYRRISNNAGGIEGGMSNGEPIVFQAVMKPIPTLYNPLLTVDLQTKQRVEASVERSDACAVPAAVIVLEHVTAWVIAESILEKFPSDTLSELKKYWEDYKNRMRNS